MKKFYRVWRVAGEYQDGSPKYNGFTELAASSPEEAMRMVGNEDWEDGISYDAIMGYEVDQIADLNGDAAVVESYGEF